jgi:hypothetical protein
MDSTSSGISNCEASQQAFRFVEVSSWEVVMEIVNEFQPFLEASDEVPLVHKNDNSGRMKRPSVLGWYRILRAHYQWPLFEAIRYALWLSR